MMNVVIVHIQTLMRLNNEQLNEHIKALPADLAKKVRVMILENKPTVTEEDQAILREAKLWPETDPGL